MTKLFGRKPRRVTTLEAEDDHMRTWAKRHELCGWLSVDIPELHAVTLPRLVASVERFLAVSGEEPTTPLMADAAEMLWVTLASVSGGNWTLQSPEWQEAAVRWRDNYFAALGPARQQEER